MSNEDDIEEIKMILLGEAGCGKTSIISRYALDKFDSNYFTTYSNTFLTKTFKYKGKKFNINIWDTVGQEKFRSLTKIFIKGSKICLLVYDITTKQSFNELQYWLDQVKNVADKDAVFGMAGNKSDLIAKQQVDDKLAINFANENNLIFGLTSAARNKSSVDELINKMLIKYIESSNPDLVEKEKDEAKIKLDSNTLNQEKKDNCSFLEFTKNLFKIKKEPKKKEEQKIWEFLSKPNDKVAKGKIKICLVGDSDVGQTYLCKNLFNEKYIDESDEKKDKKYNKTLCYNDKYYDAEIYSFSSGKGDPDKINNSDIIICLFAFNDENSYNELLNYWYPFIQQKNTNKNTIIGIAENKNDLMKRNSIQFDVDIKSSNNEIKKALNVDNDIIFEKISCKTNLNVNKFMQRILSKCMEVKKIN